MVTLIDVQSFGTTSIGKLRIFEVHIKFSDGSTRLWEMTIEPQLKQLECPVTRLSETKKLREWILGAGKAFFENQVNTRPSQQIFSDGVFK